MAGLEAVISARLDLVGAAAAPYCGRARGARYCWTPLLPARAKGGVVARATAARTGALLWMVHTGRELQFLADAIAARGPSAGRGEQLLGIASRLRRKARALRRGAARQAELDGDVSGLLAIAARAEFAGGVLGDRGTAAAGLVAAWILSRCEAEAASALAAEQASQLAARRHFYAEASQGGAGPSSRWRWPRTHGCGTTRAAPSARGASPL